MITKMTHLNINPKRMRGFSLLELMLVLGVSAVVGVASMNQLGNAQKMTQAKLAGEQIKAIALATDNYIALRSNVIGNGTSVIGAGTAADPGPRTCVSAGGGYNCTMDLLTLVREGLLPAGYSSLTTTNPFGSKYALLLHVAGTSPNRTIDGVVETVSPWLNDTLSPLSASNQPRGDLLGIAIQAAGPDSGQSVLTPANTLMGYSGIWKFDQTQFPGFFASPGQLAMRSGYAASTFSAYLPRNGSLPMTGQLNMGGNDIINAKNVNATYVNANTITATAVNSGRITNSGTITSGGNITTNGDITVYGNGEVAGLLTTSNLHVAGSEYVANLQAYNDAYFNNSIHVGGNVLADYVAANNMYNAGTIQTGQLTSTGNIYAPYGIVLGATVQAGGGGLITGLSGDLGTGCAAGPGTIAHDNATNTLMTCQAGIWGSAGGAGSGGLIAPNIRGTFSTTYYPQRCHVTGAQTICTAAHTACTTADPYTGACSCLPNYTPILTSESGSGGRNYVCT